MPGFIGSSNDASGSGSDILFPKEFVDPVTKLRISQPENLIDTDFEYGLQPTKWETLELINNTPSFFSKSGDTTLNNIQAITTNAGTREITVNTLTDHGLAVGIPIQVTGTKSVTVDGSYIINSIPNATTFTYLCKDVQDDTSSVEDLYSSIITGEFFQGSQIRVADSEGIVTDGASISELTVTTESTHGFGVNTPFYFLNLNSTISQEFQSSNTASKSFDASNSATAQTFDGSNSLSSVNIDWSNSAVVGGIASTISSVSTVTNLITVSHGSENFAGKPVGTPLYYDVVAGLGYLYDNPRGVVFIKDIENLGISSSTFTISSTPDGDVIEITSSVAGTFQLANQARTFSGNNVNPVTQVTTNILSEDPFAFEGANDGGLVDPDTELAVCTIAGFSAGLVTVTASDSNKSLDFYQNAMVFYSTTGAAATGLTNNTTYWIDDFFPTTPGVYRLTLKTLPTATAISSISGGTGVQTLTRIGVSADKEIVHVKDADFGVGDMLEYSYPSGGRFAAGVEKNYYFVETKYDIHNYTLSDVPAENYFGTGANGNAVIATTTSLVTANKSGSYSADMVVMNYESLTINSGATLTTDQPCRGLLIYVKGDCTINGTLSMTARGANANPTVGGASDGNAVDASGLRFPFQTVGGTQSISTTAALLNGCGVAARSAIANHPSLSGSGTVLTIPRFGATGAAAIGCGTGYAVNYPSNGINGQTGGGGGGGRATGGMYAGVGQGGVGSCFSGGAGSGGSSHAGSSICASPSGNGGDFGGAGGYATAYTGTANGNGHTAGGGAGNPGQGTAVGNATPFGEAGLNGTGGLIVLVVGGTLTINSGGRIEANGSRGGNKSRGEDGAGGGGSGGGSIALVYRNNLVNNGTVVVSGGAGGSGNISGSAGGNGSIQTLKVL